MQVDQAFLLELAYLASLIKVNEVPVRQQPRNVCVVQMNEASILYETSKQARQWNALIVRGLALQATELRLEQVNGEVIIRYIVDGVIVTDGKI